MYKVISEKGTELIETCDPCEVLHVLHTDPAAWAVMTLGSDGSYYIDEHGFKEENNMLNERDKEIVEMIEKTLKKYHADKDVVIKEYELEEHDYYPFMTGYLGAALEIVYRHFECMAE